MVPGFLSAPSALADAADADLLAFAWLLEQSSPGRWALGDDDLRLLLGAGSAEFQLWRDAVPGRTQVQLTVQARERIGFLFRLDCILSIVTGASERWEAFRMPTSGTSFFNGLSIRDYLLAAPDTSRFLAVCNYLQGHVILGRPLNMRQLN